MTPVLFVVGVAAIGTCALAALVRSNGRHAVPLPIVLLLTAFTFGALLPRGAAFGVQVLALGVPFQQWFKSERRGTGVVAVSGLLIALWLALILHPNVPTLGVGLLGARKTTAALAGLVLGCSVPLRHVRRVESLIVRLLVLALGTSIVSFLWVPQISERVSRSADVYTALIDGHRRLQGVFTGPFHVALAAVLAINWAVLRWRLATKTAILVGSIGISGLYLARVRTAWIALFVSLLVILLVSGTRRVRARRAAMLGICVAIAASFAFTSEPTSLDSITTSLSGDTRFTNRFEEYHHGLNLVERSPILGWGAGSAGDTLGPDFADGEHVTSHNIVLKIAVEGGLLGLILWLALFHQTLRALNTGASSGSLAITSLAALGVMGVTGSAIETLPVSFLLLVLVGIAVDSEPRGAGDHGLQDHRRLTASLRHPRHL